MQHSEVRENLNTQIPPHNLEEDDRPTLLAVKIVNSLRLMGSRSMDMRNIPGEIEQITEAVRWLEKRKFVDVMRGTLISKGKTFAQWSY